jgi:hypothetical protein
MLCRFGSGLGLGSRTSVKIGEDKEAPVPSVHRENTGAPVTSVHRENTGAPVSSVHRDIGDPVSSVPRKFTRYFFNCG